MNKLGAVMIGVILMGCGLFFRFNAENLAGARYTGEATADVANIFVFVGLLSIVAGLICRGRWAGSEIDS